MDDLEWEDPPGTATVTGKGQKPGRYARVAAQLRENVGRWAKLPGERTVESAVRAAQNVRRGTVKGFDIGRFETAVQDGQVWVRCTDATQEPANGSAGRRLVAVSSSPDGEGPPAPEVRRWAQQEGYDVPERGRLPQDLIDAYRQAHTADGGM
jgi:hypothetical protein